MDLGIDGRRAAVAASTAASASRPPPRWPPKASASRSAVATATRSSAAAREIGHACRPDRRRRRTGRRRDRVRRSRDATRSAASTSSCRTRAARRRATSRRRRRRRVPRGVRAELPLDDRDVRRRGPGDAGAAVGAGGGDHVDLGAPADPDLILSNTARAGVTGFLKTLAREVAGDGVTVNSSAARACTTPSGSVSCTRSREHSAASSRRACSATPPTSARSRRSSARSPPATSPARRSPSTAARTRGSSDRLRRVVTFLRLERRPRPARTIARLAARPRRAAGRRSPRSGTYRVRARSRAQRRATTTIAVVGRLRRPPTDYLRLPGSSRPSSR